MLRESRLAPRDRQTRLSLLRSPTFGPAETSGGAGVQEFEAELASIEDGRTGAPISAGICGASGVAPHKVVAAIAVDSRCGHCGGWTGCAPRTGTGNSGAGPGRRASGPRIEGCGQGQRLARSTASPSCPLGQGGVEGRALVGEGCHLLGGCRTDCARWIRRVRSVCETIEDEGRRKKAPLQALVSPAAALF